MKTAAQTAWAIVFSVALALSGPLGMVGSARLAWAEQGIVVSSADPVEFLPSGDPEGDDTGSLDPPATGQEEQRETVGNISYEGLPDGQEGAAQDGGDPSQQAQDAVQNEMGDGGSADVSEEGGASEAADDRMALSSNEEGWLRVTLAGTSAGTLHVSLVGRTDALWGDLLAQAVPEASVYDDGSWLVDVSLEVAGEGAYDLPGVMPGVVVGAALVDADGAEVCHAVGEGAYVTNAVSDGSVTFDANGEHIVDGNCPKIRDVASGRVAWCADSRRAAPGTSTETGDWPQATYAQVSAWDVTTVSGVTLGNVLPQLEYVMAQVDSSTDQGIYMAQQAIWTFTNPDRVSYGSYPSYNDEICALVDAANAYAQSGEGTYADTCRIYKPTTGDAYYDTWLQYVALSTWAPPALGAVELFKASSAPLITDGNGCYTLKDAQYGVYTDEACTSLALTLLTDEAGHAASDAVLAEGTYWVKEIAPSKGYALDEGVYRVEVVAGQAARVNGDNGGTVPEEPQGDPQAIVVRKVDAVSGKNVPQGDMSLEGAEITMRYYQGSYSKEQLLAGDAPQPARTWVLKTDKDGVAVMLDQYKVSGDDFYYVGGKPFLPLGTVSVQETAAPTGYALDTELYVGNFDSDMTGKGHIEFGGAALISEKPLMGGLALHKVDAEGGKAQARGAASLDGAVFGIYNASRSSVTVDGEEYAPETEGSVAAGTAKPVRSIVVRDGVATTDEDGDGADASLPFGTYLVREVSAGDGYLTDGAIQRVEVKAAGEMAWCEREFANQVARGDAALNKVDGESGQAMAGVAFLMTSDTTGESHVVMTDSQGRLDTGAAAHPHTAGTNANDAAYDFVTGKLDESKLDPDAGVWFYGSCEQAGSVNDDLGALPYDTYTLQELESPASAGTYLVALHVSVDGSGQTAELGEVQDVRVPTLATELVSLDGSHSAYPLADEVLTDTATYAHFAPGSYTAVVEFYDAEGNLLKDAAGKEMRATKQLELAGSGSYQVALPCDLSDLAGKTVVAKHCVYGAAGELYASHVDLASASQTVRVTEPPAVATTLTSQVSGLHVVDAAQTVVLTDTVAYSGLKPGVTYTLSGSLMDKESASELLGADGKPVTATVEFTPKEASGTATVLFAFDASGLAGKSIVAFERLSCQGRELAVHTDISDEAQTVIVPKVATSLATSDGARSIMGDGAIDLVDTVEYTNVLPGATYRVTGSLYDAKTDEPLKAADGTAVSASTTFVAQSSNGTAKVTFKAVSGVREGQVVAFEDLFIATDGEGETATGWQLVGTHRDLADAQQTVSFRTPDLRTALTEEQAGLHECAAIESVTLIDLVSYEGLEVGKTYSVKGTLVDKETGKALSDAQGKAMQATGTFKTTGAKGSINVRFEIDASQLAGRQVVAFESIAFNGREIAAHANLDDSAQTVTFVDIHTTATDAADGDHEAYAGTQTKLVDQVEMRGLMPGQAYSLVTELVLADSHETLLASSTRFLPTKSATTLEVTATLDTSKLAGKKLVFLETLQREGKTLAKHCDYSDENQTVGIVEVPPAAPGTPSGDIPQTGQGLAWAALLGGGGAVAAAGCVLMVRKQGLAPAKAGGSSSKPAAGAGKRAQQAARATDPGACGHIRPSRTKPIPGWRPRNGH